jgi:protein-tyrosine kinase
MSLVEQAMSRMRRSASRESLEKTDHLPPRGAANVPTPPGPTPSARVVNIDVNSLRARGYLPEESKDREFAEHYRRIKRPLIKKALAAAEGEVLPPANSHAIMVTSALAGDGKTFTSINLAFSLARERDLSVLLVDTDLLKPHVSRIFGVQKEPGLLDALVDPSLAIESLILTTNVNGLSILPAGARTEGTAELLHSDRMREIVARLCDLDPRRIVLLDSPPMLMTSEAPALTAVAGQIVLVVRAGQTPSHAVVDAVNMIDAGRAGGIILNEAPADLTRGYYYGYGKYGDENSPKS